MIKNIVFDIGNVLINFKPIGYLSQKFKDPELVERLNTTIFRSSEWPQLDQGIITEDEAFLKFCTRCPEDRNAILDVSKDWYDMLTPIDGTVKILKEIKQKGYRTYLLSNYHINSFQKVYSENSFFGLFDGAIVSAKVKCLKPNPEIYHCLVNQYNIIPGETVFIDDTVENTKAAEKLGFRVINFISPDQLRRDLEALTIF